jgi:hypothetical protein
MERPAAALWVDPKVHAAEVARFRSKIVAGPRDEDCSIWTGSIGADGYGRNYITPKGIGFCVRPNRYALALESGHVLGGDVCALHECDIPLCVKVNPAECLRQHVIAGTQQENMRRMARARRGGGRPTIRGLGREARRARSVALRDAVRDRAWDADAVYSALLGSEPRLF